MSKLTRVTSTNASQAVNMSAAGVSYATLQNREAYANLRVLWVPSQPAVLRWQVSTHIKLARREEFNAYSQVE